MALPKKGTRKITVDGVQYRWLGFIQSKKLKMPNERFDELIVELSENAGEKVRAKFIFEHIKTQYQNIGKHLQSFDRFPPYVRQTILVALKNGWKPNAGGGIRELGCLDEKIDYSDLKSEI